VSAWQRDFAQKMGDLVLVDGTPRAVMRVLGWMVVCQPSEQTAADIQAELGLSAGSVSTAVRKLGELGLLEGVTRSGDRRTYHRLREHGWERVLERRFRDLGEMRDLADSAIDAARGDSDERLHEMRDTYALMEEGFASLLRQSLRRTTGWSNAETGLVADA
jgi:DNA-binding transcriptional regulator GbsR (MarR family)